MAPPPSAAATATATTSKKRSRVPTKPSTSKSVDTQSKRQRTGNATSALIGSGSYSTSSGGEFKPSDATSNSSDTSSESEAAAYEEEEEDPAEVDSDDIDAAPIPKKGAAKTKKVKPVIVEESEADESEASDDLVVHQVTKSKKEVKKVSPVKKAKVDKDGKNTRVVQTQSKFVAPKEDCKTSRILPTTMDFLAQLAKEGNNDRDWFKARDPLFRHAEVNWKTFVGALVPLGIKADWTLPHLPPSDLIHRIYRDVRFSKEKSPYKLNFAASMSRTGRKSSFAMYYIHIQPGGKTTLAAGVWDPSSSDLTTIRHAILADPTPLRKVIAEPTFVKFFGEPKKPSDGSRQSLWGQENELKNAPKLPGVTKDHKDIDLLRLKSIAVSCRLTDEQVLADTFLETVYDIMTVLCPFVQCLNEMILPTPKDSDDEAADDEEGEEVEEKEEEEAVASSEDGNKGDEGNDDGDEEEEEEEE